MNTNKILFLFMLLLFVGIGIVGCTTTTKTVTTNISVKPLTALEKAKMAFSKKDYPLARILLKPLAENGENFSQYALGYMYYNAMGGKRNYSQAIHWLKLSAKNGNKNAIEALRLISSTAENKLADIEEGNTAEVSNAEITKAPPEPIALKNDELNNNKQTATFVNKPNPKPKANMEMVPVSDSSTGTDTKITHPMPGSVSVEETLDKPTERKKDSTVSLTKGEKWIVAQPDANYTIQLLISGSEITMQEFIINHQLENNSVYYRSPNNGNELFILVQGSFESFTKATQTISSMSEELKAAEPWVRTVGVIKEKLLSR